MSGKLLPKILVIESYETADVVLSIRNTVERYSFDVVVSKPENAISQATFLRPNIIIISSRLQNFTIKELSEMIVTKARLPKVPIIFVMSNDEPRPVGIQNIFYEVLYKPFSAAELIKIIKICFRKSQPTLQDKIKKYKDVSIELSTYRVYRNGKLVHMGPTEFKILNLLMERPKEILTREYIINHVWDNNIDILYRTVDVHVNRLRDVLKEALGTERHKDDFIKTVRSKGYCLNLPGEIEESCI